MGRSSRILLGGALVFLLGSASGQDSCVQVSNVSFVTSCPCDAGSELTFQMVGETTVAANKVNVAVITDASGSVSDAQFDLEKEFAKNAVASFASRNLFDNGGTASYASFATTVSEGGTFSSAAEFNEFVDNDPRESGSTNIEAGLSKGRELLNADSSATASFLILITDGEWNIGADPQIEADAARAEGTIVYAVGVGTAVPEETLLSIGGDPANVFDVSDFTELDSALDEIIFTSADSIPCAATGAVVTVEFNAMVTAASVEGSSGPTSNVGGNVVVFDVPNLEATPTSFEVVLDTCGETEGTPIVASVSYVDEENNTPYLGSIEEAGDVPTCDGPTTPSPTIATREIPTPAPSTDFSFSFSYTFEPWYDDDYDVGYDPVSPGPSPDYAEPPPAMPVPAPTTPGTTPVSPSPLTTTGPPPTAPTPTGTRCSNGVEGVESADGRACCVTECGSCGGVGCSRFSPDLGAGDCCVTEIVDHGEACSVWGAAPCYIDGASPVPSSTEGTPTAPTTPGTAPTSPGPAPVSPAGTTCNNGIYGVESASGKVCCVAECGSCGGVGCSRFSPDLGADDCCITEILNHGEACSVAGAAPCYVDDGAVPGPAPTAKLTDSPADEFSFSFFFSYSFSYDYADDEDAPIPAPTPAPAPVAAAVGTPVSVTESFTVQVPELDETSVDFGLLVDVSGSYRDDIVNLKLLANDLVDGLAARTADLALGLGSFSDFNGFGSEYTLLKAFGSCSDDVCFEEEKDDFTAAVDTLSASGGGDTPESQTVALVRAAEDWSWRDGVLKVLAITTDAPFHVGDGYFTLDEVIDACNARSIKILALKAPGSDNEMDTVADGTGGVVATTESDSEDIVTAILQGLEGVQYSNVDVDWVCEDSSWTITADPSSGYDNVDGGAMLDFTVTVSVPAGATAGTTCAANVLADEVLVGGQEFTAMADGTVTVTAVTP